MTKNNNTILGRIKAFFFKKKSSIGYTGQEGSLPASNHTEMFKKVLQAPGISHEDLTNLSKTFFNTEIKGKHYRFRSGGPYGLVFAINGIRTLTDDDGKLVDIFINFKDCSMDTSLTVTTSVKDLDEMFKHFELKLPSKIRN